MAFERLGLGGVLSFNQRRAVTAMRQARDEFGRFKKTTDDVGASSSRFGQSLDRTMQRLQVRAQALGASLNKVGQGFRNFTMAALPAALVVGKGVKTAASFEQQMSGVNAITGATAEEFAALTAEAKRMGVVSVFTAKQSGEAMEYLARAGAKPTQIIDSLSGVMNAAAADSMDLGTAADITANVVKGMGLEWKDAAHIADVLALTSARTNTNITQLGESFRYGMASARELGLSIEETAAIFGKLADAGSKGSMAGTSFMNMMNKLTKTSKKAGEIHARWGIRLVDSTGKLLPVGTIVDQFSVKMQGLKSAAERARLSSELFGIRGKRAYSALAAAGKDSLGVLLKELNASSEGIGKAQEMATKRLDNLLGAFTLFGSSVQQASIEIFGPMMTPLKDSVKGITEALNAVLFAFQHLKAETMDETELIDKFGLTATRMAQGLNDAVNAMKDGWAWIVDTVKSAKKWITDTFGPEGMRTFSKWAVVVTVAAAALVPVLIGVGALVFLLKSVLIPILSGLAGAFMAAFWPVLLVGGAAYLLLKLLGRENESLGETAARVWGNISAWITDVWRNKLEPFYLGMKTGMREVGAVFDEVWLNIKTTFGEVADTIGETWGQLFGDMNTDWRSTGVTAGEVLGGILSALAAVVEFIVVGFGRAIQFIAWVFKAIDDLMRDSAEQFELTWGDGFWAGLQKIAIGFLEPLKGFVADFLETIGEGLDLLGADDTAQRMRVAAGALRKMEREGTTFEQVMFPGTAKKRERFARIRRDEEEAAIDAAIRQKELTGYYKTHEQRLAEQTAAMKAAGEKEKGKKPTVEATINMNDNRKLDVKNTMCVDGKAVATASMRHQTEIQERSGFKTTPWQRRIALETGTPATVNIEG